MNKPDWRSLELDNGVLREPAPNESQLVLWVPGETVACYRQWERIATVPDAGIASAQSYFKIPATVIRVRQKVQGFFDRLLQFIHKPPANRSWLLPNGQSAEQ